MIGPMLRHCPDLGIKSIFVPLHTEHWNAFRDRRKSIEWRAWGARWNDRTITPGRTIILSKGYTKTRLHGVVVKVHRVSWLLAPDGALAIYPDVETFCAIEIALQ
jgi:hypothetical protein